MEKYRIPSKRILNVEAWQVDLQPPFGMSSLTVQGGFEEVQINKADATHAHDAGDVLTGAFADGRISQSSVTQHQGAIDHGSIAGLADDDHTQYLLPAAGGWRATTDTTLSGTLSKILLDVEDMNTGEFTFSAANDEVTIDEDGKYCVTYSITVKKTVSTTANTQCQFVLLQDTGSGYAAVACGVSHQELRLVNLQRSLSWTCLVSASAGDKLQVQGRLLGGSDVDVSDYVLTITRVAR